jgi:hypothetical protein
MFSQNTLLYSLVLVLILLPCSYFLMLLAHHILLRVVMFRRVNLQKMSKRQAALFHDERKHTLRDQFVWLVVFAITLDYATLFTRCLTGNRLVGWPIRDFTAKSLLCLYLWAFLFWHDYHRWKERIRTGHYELFAHCQSYLAALWFLVALIFLLISL